MPSDAPNGKHVGRSWLPTVAEVIFMAKWQRLWNAATTGAVMDAGTILQPMASERQDP